KGRYFSEHDGPDSPPVAIVNQTLVRRYWPGEDAVGKHLKGFDPRGRNDEWVTVVAVVGDTHSYGLERSRSRRSTKSGISGTRIRRTWWSARPPIRRGLLRRCVPRCQRLTTPHGFQRSRPWNSD